MTEKPMEKFDRLLKAMAQGEPPKSASKRGEEAKQKGGASKAE